MTSATAYLGLGSNLGDRAALMRAAVRALDACPGVRVDFQAGVASLYATAPVGRAEAASQPAYLNSALGVTTGLSPMELLAVGLSIEAALGRTRRRSSGSSGRVGKGWEPRVIDVDMLFYEDLVIDDQDLSLPHPRLHERRFVLEPLAEIAGGFVHPVLGVSVEDLAIRQRAAGVDGEVKRLMGTDWPNRGFSIDGCRLSADNPQSPIRNEDG